MPGPQATPITLTPRQKKILTELSIGTHSPLHLKQRSEIILLAHEGVTNHAIRRTTGLTRDTVILWRNRFAAAKEELLLVEQQTPYKLRASIQLVLSDAKRPGAPPTFTPQQQACILALSCQEPASLGLPFSHWTPSLLREEAIRQGIVPSISAMQISRFLKRRGFKTPSGQGMAEPQYRRLGSLRRTNQTNQ